MEIKRGEEGGKNIQQTETRENVLLIRLFVILSGRKITVSQSTFS